MAREGKYALPLELRQAITSLVKRTANLDDQELNRLIMEREEYHQLLSGSLPDWS